MERSNYIFLALIGLAVIGGIVGTVRDRLRDLPYRIAEVERRLKLLERDRQQPPNPN